MSTGYVFENIKNMMSVYFIGRRITRYDDCSKVDVTEISIELRISEKIYRSGLYGPNNFSDSCRNSYIVVCYKRIMPRIYLVLKRVEWRLAYGVNILADGRFLHYLLCCDRSLFRSDHIAFFYMACICCHMHIAAGGLGSLCKT